jgi:hypothetical protein
MVGVTCGDPGRTPDWVWRTSRLREPASGREPSTDGIRLNDDEIVVPVTVNVVGRNSPRLATQVNQLMDVIAVTFILDEMDCVVAVAGYKDLRESISCVASSEAKVGHDGDANGHSLREAVLRSVKDSHLPCVSAIDRDIWPTVAVEIACSQTVNMRECAGVEWRVGGFMECGLAVIE